AGGRAGRRAGGAAHGAPRRGRGQRGAGALPGPRPGPARLRGGDRAGRPGPRQGPDRGRARRGRPPRAPVRRRRCAMTGRDLVVTNIGTLVTPVGPAPRRGSELGAVRETARAAIVAAAGRIAYAGPEARMPADVVPARAAGLDAGGAAVVPGFVDAHTHLAYAGDRDGEIRQRLAGRSYAEIAAAGGGIVRTVAATRAASADALEALLASRLDEMLLCGTTTAEVKSGYGLETSAEIRSLEAIRAAGARHPITLVPTFLGAHEVPPEHRARREAYVDLLV